MKQRLASLSISLASVVIIASSFQSRSALGLVVEACKINVAITGSPYPCMKVVQDKDPMSSYAVLREPANKERTILAPLADVSGIEDPRLLTVGAPNYFEDAWNERSAAISFRAMGVPPQDFALAINAASWRTQDRLHVHIGCSTPRFRTLLKSHKTEIGGSKFTKLKDSGWWAKFYAADNLSKLNPLKAVADGVDGALSNMKNVVIGVFASTLPDDQQGFYILARLIGASKSRGSAEDMIDPSCQF
ncbi:CDP-diacylglycerol diphosphatase [Rhizobium sp. BK376]|uniref:CDP-diacylglycerol diphosphatase n=1 Tax=Rhizobium sp. BK376 TaxID=2512149 RepID=UPI00104C78EA|nr:CDP-diacylglycerol diphosphatase [Rhizobium sp. BK376]TCR73194.1 CDP-diacylglycerol pyrophosphatase [Rhizobium sp. BK376]